MDLWRLLSKAAHEFGTQTAVVDGGTRHSYADLHSRALRLAGYLHSQGVDTGDRVSILAVNSSAYLEAYYAAAALGAILNPLNTRLSSGEIQAVLQDAGSSFLLADTQFSPLTGPLTQPPPTLWLDDAGYEKTLAGSPPLTSLAAVAGDDVAHLYYTSGSTGRAKGVMLTHRNVSVHAMGNIAELHLTDGDVWGHFAPLFHLADAWAAFALTWVGGTHVTLGRFEPGEVLSLIERERITATALIPTMLNMLVNSDRLSAHRYDSLRMLLTSGAPIAEELIQRALEAFECDYVQAYGLTETCPHIAMGILKKSLKALPADRQLAFRCKTGRPFLAVELRVVDDDGRPVARDGQQVGEIQVRGETVTPGYWKNPQATAATFSDGWFCTGDLAVLDNEGYLNIVDRKKDMIVTGGENVYSAEVENVLYACPSVLEAAVFGVPDPKWGEAVKAAVVLRPGQSADAASIIAFCHAHLAGYKVPKSLDFLPELPRTGSGKIAKKVLRDPYWKDAAKQV